MKTRKALIVLLGACLAGCVSSPSLSLRRADTFGLAPVERPPGAREAAPQTAREEPRRLVIEIVDGPPPWDAVLHQLDLWTPLKTRHAQTSNCAMGTDPAARLQYWAANMALIKADLARILKHHLPNAVIVSVNRDWSRTREELRSFQNYRKKGDSFRSFRTLSWSKWIDYGPLLEPCHDPDPLPVADVLIGVFLDQGLTTWESNFGSSSFGALYRLDLQAYYPGQECTLVSTRYPDADLATLSKQMLARFRADLSPAELKEGVKLARKRAFSTGIGRVNFPEAGDVLRQYFSNFPGSDAEWANYVGELAARYEHAYQVPGALPRNAAITTTTAALKAYSASENSSPLKGVYDWFATRLSQTLTAEELARSRADRIKAWFGFYTKADRALQALDPESMFTGTPRNGTTQLARSLYDLELTFLSRLTEETVLKAPSTELGSFARNLLIEQETARKQYASGMYASFVAGMVGAGFAGAGAAGALPNNVAASFTAQAGVAMSAALSSAQTVDAQTTKQLAERISNAVGELALEGLGETRKVKAGSYWEFREKMKLALKEPLVRLPD